MNHFDYMTSITSSKIDIMCDDIDEKAYNSFMVNRGLSYFYDTVLFANEMNKYSHLDSRLQYDFLRQIVRKKKRFSKWNKASKEDNINLIKEYYGYSNEKAHQIIDLLSEEQLAEIKIKLFKGGKRKP